MRVSVTRQPVILLGPAVACARVWWVRGVSGVPWCSHLRATVGCNDWAEYGSARVCVLGAHAAGRAPIFMTKTWRRLPWSSPSRGEPSVWLVMGMGVAAGLKNV